MTQAHASQQSRAPRGSLARRRGALCVLALLAVAAAGGCDALDTPAAPGREAGDMKRYTSTMARVQRQVQQKEKHASEMSAYIIARREGYNDNFDGIALNRDGTYSRTIVDPWGRSYQQQGTWHDYGVTGEKHIELDGYSESHDVVRMGGPQNAPKTTRDLAPGEYVVR